MHNQISFFSKYYKVIAVDNRNQGKSDKLDTVLTYKLMAHDVLNLIDTLKLTTVNILGWSDGANIGLEMARISPQKISKLIMMSGNYKIDTTVVDNSIIEELKLKARTSKDKIDRSLFQLELKNPKLSKEDLKNIKTKTLILNADNDIIKPSHSKEMHEFLSNSKLFIVPSSTHMLPLENPELFNYLTFNYLKSTNDSIRITGKISCSDKDKLEYVNIGIRGKSFGTTTNKDGLFQLKMPFFDFVKDSLYISFIGYNAKLVPITDFVEGGYYDIILDKKAYEIREITVKAGKLKTRTYGIKSVGNMAIIRGTENAIFVHSNNYPTRVKYLRFALMSNNDSINFRINFYNVKNSMPGEILINKKLLFSEVPDNEGWITCDLAKYNLFLEQDFFVAVEMLPNHNAENQDKPTFKAKMVAISNPSFTRDLYNKWEKIPIGTALNITLQFNKN
jgi:hypothetical protein